MNYVSNTQVAAWYGPPCKQPIVRVPMFGTSIPLNKNCARLFRRLDNIFKNKTPDYYKDILLEPNEWGYVCRPIAGSSSYSKHAWGIALDIEASENNQGVPYAQTEVWKKGRVAVQQAEREGFTWGGRFSNPDAMHFEVAVSPEWIKKRYWPNGSPKKWWKKELAGNA